MSQAARKPMAQFVNIPCQIQPGPFPGEYLVNITIGDQIVSGFVRENFLTFSDSITRLGSGFVRGNIVNETEKETTVQLPPGSYFTTANGITSVSSQWAKSNFQPVSA